MEDNVLAAENVEETAEAVVESVKQTDIVVLGDKDMLTLKKSINGVDTLYFKWEKLTGRTLLTCARLARKDDKLMSLPILSQAYLAHVASAACGLKYDDIVNMPADDFTALTSKVLNFLSPPESD